ncbi:MAG TPA: DUF6799 domain-containing protein [Bacteroidia bacterium]|jgi:hypothetical protein|nr:DUF6799 domain-containing protein [Bacteroidia bacterium]
MKKVITIVAVACSLGAYAQDTTKNIKSTTPTNENPVMFPPDIRWNQDGAVFKDGKVYSRVNGKLTLINENTTLNNGTVIGKDGKVTLNNGKNFTLENGQYIDMDGNIRTPNK